jgi:hypothetical protein
MVTFWRTVRQTDMYTGRQKYDKEANCAADRQTDRHTCTETSWQTYSLTDKQIVSKAVSLTFKETIRLADRHRQRQTDRQASGQTHTALHERGTCFFSQRA